MVKPTSQQPLAGTGNNHGAILEMSLMTQWYLNESYMKMSKLDLHSTTDNIGQVTHYQPNHASTPYESK